MHDYNNMFIKAAQKAKKSVVNISIYRSKNDARKKSYTRAGYASGTIISNTGYVVTNYHVVSKGDYYRITLYDGRECDLVPIRKKKYLFDAKTDIALMRIAIPEEYGVVSVEFGDSHELMKGEWVLAIGNPYGLHQSISSGIVSSKGRNDIGFADIEDFIQTDVAINPGNSGGPLVNLEGRLVGINTAIRTVTGGYQGISFAIPSNTVKTVCTELVKYGRVRRGWLGFLVRQDNRSPHDEKYQVQVISVIKNSPADRAGIKKNDIIREVDGRQVNSLGEVVKMIGSKPIGSTVEIVVGRNGKLYRYRMLLTEKEQYQAMQRVLRYMLSRYGIELDENAASGDVVVSYLSPMGPGYQAGLHRGDVIISMNGERVRSLDDAIRIYKKSHHRIREISVLRNKREVAIEIE
ncbi:MAG: trypsin-like peptidase domain-containing protein [Spirochaetota bacterium]